MLSVDNKVEIRKKQFPFSWNRCTGIGPQIGYLYLYLIGIIRLINCMNRLINGIYLVSLWLVPISHRVFKDVRRFLKDLSETFQRLFTIAAEIFQIIFRDCSEFVLRFSEDFPSISGRPAQGGLA